MLCLLSNVLFLFGFVFFNGESKMPRLLLFNEFKWVGSQNCGA